LLLILYGEMGVFFTHFVIMTFSLGVNNLSLVTFVEFAAETILYGGDVEEKGWLELLKNYEFITNLKKTTILIASHHGNDSGYCKDLFKYFRPKITILSTGKYDNSNAVSMSITPKE
ncbi:MAG: hypothetical protein OXC46_10780, partial [Thaumarchaeota archaeon]|nr:hypothetical protein [Nitrososphaerota archaeon]